MPPNGSNLLPSPTATSEPADGSTAAPAPEYVTKCLQNNILNILKELPKTHQADWTANSTS